MELTERHFNKWNLKFIFIWLAVEYGALLATFQFDYNYVSAFTLSFLGLLVATLGVLSSRSVYTGSIHWNQRIFILLFQSTVVLGLIFLIAEITNCEWLCPNILLGKIFSIF